MENNKIGNISVNTSKRPRKRFNLAYDVNTTSSWGETQPSVCRFMYPNTKNVLSAESLVRLAPMLAPTFGRISTKQYHQFVDIEDICPTFTAMMAQTSYNGSSNYVPQCVPRVPLAILSLFVLSGAKCTIYSSGSSAAGDETKKLVELYDASSSDMGDALVLYSAFANKFSYIGVGDGVRSLSPDYQNYFYHQSYTGPTLDVAQFFNLNTNLIDTFRNRYNLGAAYKLDNIYLPIGNPYSQTFFHDTTNYDTELDYYISGNGIDGYDAAEVPLDTADYVIPIWIDIDGNNNLRLQYFAFRLSAYGKRLRKILLGCGYQIDFNNVSEVSLLPLFAYYKAYYDLFGLTQNHNFQDTNLSKLIQFISYNNYLNLGAKLICNSSDSNAGALCRLFSQFIEDLGELWVTDNNDFVSAHIDSVNKSASPVGIKDNFVSVSDGSNIGRTSTAEGPFDTIDSNPFSALDVELLKRLYRWSNVNTIAGKQIADALRAAGFGSYVDSTKTNFIGYDEDMIQVSDVVSMSDTYKSENGSASGSILGEYGGKGIGYQQTKSFVFETDKFGYWIGIFAVVPKSGYSQGLDLTLLDTEKFDFYNSEFDGLGYQMSPKLLLGTSDFGAFLDVYPDASFGLIPRYSEWKYQKNISNGDFSIRGKKSVYLPYCLDKEIPIGERAILDRGHGSGKRTFQMLKMFPMLNLPTAGEVWRYVARYPWLSTYDRIFANFAEGDLFDRLQKMVNAGGVDNLEPIVQSDDNFLVHMICNLQSYAPMLEIEDSFGTDDDGSFDGSMEKS